MDKVLDKLDITDEDINWIESLLGNIVFDASRREIIKRMDSFDVQAFPGTGKTTVLVAKLAILAKKWNWEKKGICVLSHTNVAKDEIEKRLSRTDIGRRILTFPHFVGTVQSFFDKYIAIPRLRSDGKNVSVIDTAFALNKRYRMLDYNTRFFLEKRYIGPDRIVATDYPAEINIGISEVTPSFQNVLSVVSQSIDSGILTYEEMMHVANRALHDTPLLASVAQERFPIVLVDEAQDSNDLQWRLISEVFPRTGNSIIQTFGDSNQAIYNNDGDSSISNTFPNEPVLSIAESKRFGPQIASVSDSLITSQIHGISGSNNSFAEIQNQKVFFLFDDITNVLPSYGRLILNTFSDDVIREYREYGVHAIGSVHTKEADKKTIPKFPIGVKDYWTEYDCTVSNDNKNFSSVIDYFRRGQIDEDAGKRENWYAQGLIRLLNSNEKGFIPFGSNPIKALSKAANEEIVFRNLFLNIVRTPFNSEDEWQKITEAVCAICSKSFDVDVSSSELLTWKIDSFSIGSETAPRNVYHFVENGRVLDIKVGSIHSEKGRTHLATLVLDTFWYDRNIKSIMPWLCGRGLDPKKRDIIRLKTHFVALSRAMALVCIAAPRHSVSNEDESGLKAKGWTIKHI